ncbi:hypothetical protein V6N13_134194 [Hibiscus sabdariffa]
MNATGPNEPIGMDASHIDRSEGVSFSWDDGVVDEGSYESEKEDKKNSAASATDLEAPVNVGSERFNETNGNEKGRDEVDGNEEARDEQRGNEADENEANLVGLCSGEET